MRTFAVISLALFGLNAFGEETIRFWDSGGVQWSRTLAQETRSGASGQTPTLLLVVENPVGHETDNAITQRVVFRKSFFPSQKTQLANALQKYRQPVEYPERVTDRRIEESIDDSPGIAKEIWPSTRSWTRADEDAYSKWFHDQVNEDLLVGSGIKVDCADFSIAARWIYAHDHNLPVMNNIGGNKMVGHFSSSPAWDKLPTNSNWKNDKRFKAILKYVLANAYTHTIFKDLYPTVISPDYVRSGTIFLLLRQTDGHTQVIKNAGMNPDECGKYECIVALWGNEPSNESVYRSQLYLRVNNSSNGGFMTWRWPVMANGSWQLTPKKDMPGYSLDQYEYTNYDDFDYYIKSSLGFSTALLSKLINLGNQLSGQLNYRAQKISDAYRYCVLHQCNDADNDGYSTNNSDQRFREESARFLALMADFHNTDDPAWLEAMQDLKQSLFYGSKVSAYDYIFNVEGAADRMSASARDDIYSRWGLSQVQDQIAAKQSTFSYWYTRRNYSAQDGLDECHEDDSVSITCDLASSDIKDLFTTTLDSDLRKIKGELLSEISLVATQTQSQIQEPLKKVRFYYLVMPNDPSRDCTAFDLLYTSLKAIENMTDSPADQRVPRLGFQ